MEKLSICDILKKYELKNKIINKNINGNINGNINENEIIKDFIEKINASWKIFIDNQFELWKKIYTNTDFLSNNILIKNYYNKCNKFFIIILLLENISINNIFTKIFKTQILIIINLINNIFILLNIIKNINIKQKQKNIHLYNKIISYIKDLLINYKKYIIKEIQNNENNKNSKFFNILRIINRRIEKKNIYSVVKPTTKI